MPPRRLARPDDAVVLDTVEDLEVGARDDAGSRTWAPSLAFVMTGFALLVAAAWFVSWWSILHPPATIPYAATFNDRLPTAFRGWAHWDANWYVRIARDGYSYQPGTQSPVAFFPTYPLTIKLLSWSRPGGMRPFVTGSLLTILSGLAVAALLWRWVVERVGADARGRRAAAASVLCLAVYPYAFYLYGAVYADALFLAGALAAFLLVEREQLVAAAVAGALASGARPVGLFLALALVLRVAERRWEATRAGADVAAPGGWRRPWRWFAPFDLRRLRRRDLVILASASGYLAYVAYLGMRFGDPFAFATVQGAPGWDQAAGWHTWSKVELLAELHHELLGPASLGLLLQALCALVALAAVPFVARRFGRAYAVYVALVVGVAAFATKDLQGVGRYVLAAFPVFGVAGTFVGRRATRAVVVAAIGVPTVLLFVSWFAKGNYLS